MEQIDLIKFYFSSAATRHSVPDDGITGHGKYEVQAKQVGNDVSFAKSTCFESTCLVINENS